MIRINLIAGERRAARAVGQGLPAAQRVAVGGGALLVVAALLIGWRYWDLGAQDARLTSEIGAAQAEEARLAEVLKQVSDFDVQRGHLQERVALIDELRRGQAAPVHIVDQISRALPEMTWLTSLKQNDYDVTIQGRSTSLASLSDFVGNLEGSRYFRRPVEIVESRVVTGQNDGPEIIEFTVKGTFQMRGLEPASAATPGGKVG